MGARRRLGPRRSGRGDDWGGSRAAQRDRGWFGGSRNEGPIAPEYGQSRGAGSYSAGGEDRYGFGGGGYGRSGYGDRDRNYRGGAYGGSGAGRDQGSDWGSSSSGSRGGYESRGDRYWDRDRYSDRDRNERGFFDRASDEVASWFGDDTPSAVGARMRRRTRAITAAAARAATAGPTTASARM